MKVAVVDTNKIVRNTPEILDLAKEQQIKSKDLTDWLKTANEKIQKEQNAEKKELLLQSYNTELAEKQTMAQKDYAARMQLINDKISKTIIQKASEGKYDVILSQSAVLYGGDDLTDDIIEAMKTEQ